MEAKITANSALEILKAHGLKYTRKRKALLEYLEKENRYLSAKEIHEQLSKEFPGLSYDTIYRNLYDFSKMNLLEETEFNGEMKFRFSCLMQGKTHHHHHFICSKCGLTKALDLCPMDFFKDQLPGCTIEGHRFEVYGYCENCKKSLTKN